MIANVFRINFFNSIGGISNEWKIQRDSTEKGRVNKLNIALG